MGQFAQRVRSDPFGRCVIRSRQTSRDSSENGQAAEALAEIERAMIVAPRRFSGTLLAARAAEAAGDAQKAQRHYRELIAIAGGGAQRPELDTARGYIAGK